MKARQSYFSTDFKPRAKHGSDVRKGRRKLSRPIYPGKALHLTLRSTKAKNNHSLLHSNHRDRVRTQVMKMAARFNIRIHQYANSGNHLHFLIQMQSHSPRSHSRKSIQDFIRAVSASVAQLVTGARRGRPFGKFWDDLAFTRIVSRGRDFVNTCFYVLRNRLEADGLMEYLPRGMKRSEKGKGRSGPLIFDLRKFGDGLEA